MIKKLSAAFFLTILLGLANPALALAATLSLNPSSGTFNRGCGFSLTIGLDTAGSATDGTDAILFYDPTRLVTATNQIHNGTIYSDFPGNNVDPQTGKITISGLASVQQPFNGQGTLASIDFTVAPTAPTGATLVNFDFDSTDKTKTTDSNVVESGTVVDVLNSVVNGSFTIGSGSCSAQTPTSPGTTTRLTGGGGLSGGQGAVSTPSGQLPVKILPPAGSQQLTFTLAILGSVMTILGILGLALL